MPTKLTSSKFLALIRELHTPHLYILRGDLTIPADEHLLKVLNKEIETRENYMSVVFCNRCPPIAQCDAVGFIPLGDNGRRINVCKRHMEEAKRLCYYVLRNGQDENASSSDFDHRTWKKHIQLRGSREFKFEPRRYQRIAKEEEAA